MQMKKWINAAMFTVVISFMGLGMAISAHADCPDKVVCEYPVATFTQEAGVLRDVPTCYKFNHGCRPWHCDGRYKDTNRDYWTAECRKAFPTTCKESNDCTASFPGAVKE